MTSMIKMLSGFLLLFSMVSCDVFDDRSSSPSPFDFQGDDDDILLTPCEDGEHINPADLPGEISTYLDQEFPGVAIVKAERYSGGFYKVKLANDIEVYFNPEGEVIAQGDDDDFRDPAEFQRLFEIAKEYLRNNYPELEDDIEEAELEFKFGRIFLEVEFNNDRGMIFDADGVLICSYTDDSSNDDDGDDDDGGDGVHIPIDDLPQSVLKYIQDNYPDATIVKAERDDSDYEVTLSNGLKLYFDLDGSFIRIKNDSDSDDDDDDDDDD